MPEGLQYSNVLDKLVAEKDGSALLIMRDDRPWDGSDEHIAELSRKINAYAAYVVDGFLVKEYPEFTNKRVRFELWSILHAPDAKTQQFIDRTLDMLKFLLPHYIHEGKSYLTIGLGCTGGRHRSPVLARELRERLAGAGFDSSVRDHDIAR